MSKTTILKSVYFLATIPVNIISNIFLYFNIFKIKLMLEKCVNEVDNKHSKIPAFYVSYLVSAEDHRSEFHYGIDQIGIVRAILKRFIYSDIQGASTIEQQFVRVVTGDYRYSFQRKFIEQLLAVLLVKERNKIDIARAYLAIAYYGHDCEGVAGISTLIASDLQYASEDQIISLMARQKYPKPSADNEKWNKNCTRRVLYIKDRHKNQLINQATDTTHHCVGRFRSKHGEY